MHPTRHLPVLWRTIEIAARLFDDVIPEVVLQHTDQRTQTTHIGDKETAWLA